MQVSTLARLTPKRWLLHATHGLLHEFLISWVPSRQQEEISEGRLDRKKRKLCQFGSDVPTPGKGHPRHSLSQLGTGNLPPFSCDSLPVIGAHLQPARATPGEAATSARSLCPVLSFQQLPPSILSCLILPAQGIPPPPTPLTHHKTECSTARRLCPHIRGRVHNSQRQWKEAQRPPLPPPPHTPNLCTWKHYHSAPERNES